MIRQAGISLFETLVAVVLVSVSAVTLLSSFSYVGTAMVLSDQLDEAARAVQECGEYLVTSKRNRHLLFADISATSCNDLPLPNGYSRSVTVASVTSIEAPACPVGANCKSIVVDVSNNAGVSSDATLVVIEY